VPPARVTSADLDRAIESAQATTANFGTVLFDLDADRDRRMIEAGGLRGRSADLWLEANHQMELLWVCYRAVVAAIDSLRLARKGSRRPAELERLWADLHGPLVELPPDALADFRRRWADFPVLLNPAPVGVVLNLMSAVYEQAAETITSLFAAQEIVQPRLGEFGARLEAIERQAQASRVPEPSELTALKNRVADMRRQLLEDPLSLDLTQIQAMSAEADRISEVVQSSADAVAELERSLSVLEAELDHRKLAIAAARPSVQDARQKIAQRSRATLDLEALEDSAASLAADIGKLRLAGPADPLSAIVTAEKLAENLSGLASATDAVVEAAGRQMEARRQLRGQLDAYRAKAQAMGRAEDGSLDQRFRAANEMLYRAPCDLDQAEQLVTAYQMALANTVLEDRLS
jgi:hypothetical protein